MIGRVTARGFAGWAAAGWATAGAACAAGAAIGLDLDGRRARRLVGDGPGTRRPAGAGAGAGAGASTVLAVAAGGVGAGPAWPIANTTDSPTTRTVRHPSAPQNQPGSSLRRTPCVVETRAVE